MSATPITINVYEKTPKFHAVTAILPLKERMCEFEGHRSIPAHAIIVKMDRDRDGKQHEILACKTCAMENTYYLEEYNPNRYEREREELNEDPSVQVVS